MWPCPDEDAAGPASLLHLGPGRGMLIAEVPIIPACIFIYTPQQVDVLSSVGDRTPRTGVIVSI